MTEVFLKRLVWLLPILFGATLISFLLLYVIPGDPVLNFVGERAAPETIKELREAWGLDQPVWLQYFNYLKRLFKGDLGFSYRTQLPVLPTLLTKLFNTFKLASVSLGIAIVLGLTWGLAAAIKSNGIISKIVLFFSIITVSIPVYLWAIFLLWLFSIYLSWLPTGGSGGYHHLLLPALCLGLRQAAMITRLTYLEMMVILQSDYIRTAHAKGLSKRKVIGKHALANAAIPIITVLGLDFASYLNGSVLTESVFAWPGLGRHTFIALLQRDLPVIQGVVIISCFVFVLINLIVDLLYILFDPRIRYE